MVASSVGTLIEWYDFFLFGSLAAVIAARFFPNSNPTTALLYTLAVFSAGFVARPFGALVFRRPSDLTGRKYPFLLTLIMGGSTFAIGLVPGYDSIGLAAPLIVLLLRLLQGLAQGGEYGDAATYVAEHSPAHRRGYFTSWIQAMPGVGLLISLGVILITRYALDADHAISIEKFNVWGWRIPFLLSIVLAAVCVYIRVQVRDSPLTGRLKPEGTFSTPLLTENPGPKANLKIVLLALFGVTMGQGILFYTGQFYAQSFVENVCTIDFDQSKTALLTAIALATPFFILFGGWSDRIGRKWIMLAGMLLAILTYPFLFGQLLKISSTEGRTELTGQKEIRTSAAFINKTRNMIQTSATLTYYEDGMVVTETQKDTVYASGKIAGKPVATITKSLNTADYWKITAILFVMVYYVTMVSGPMAAFLAELFPAGIRSAALLLPGRTGNGIFGGMTPFIATLLTTIYTGNKLAGLWYPIGVAVICLVIGVICIPRGAGRGDDPQGGV